MSPPQGRPSGVAEERRSRRSPGGTFIGIKTGLASTLSARTLQLKGQCSFKLQGLAKQEIFSHFLASITCI